MADYRQIQCAFWTDKFVLRLTPEEKYFYLYLLTNPKTSQCGAYELPIQIAVFETGYNVETIHKLLHKFHEYGKAVYDSDTEEVYLVNWLSHNWIDSEKVIPRVIKDASKIKSNTIRLALDDVLKSYGYGIDTVAVERREKKVREDKSGIPCPDDFIVTDDMKSWALTKGLSEKDIKSETEKFQDHHRAKGNKFKDWGAAWKNWMRNVIDWRGGPRKPATKPKEFPR